MFKPKGLAGLSRGVHKVPNGPMPGSSEGAPDMSAPAAPSYGGEEDGASTGEHIGMRGAAGVPRRPRGLGRLGPK